MNDSKTLKKRVGKVTKYLGLKTQPMCEKLVKRAGFRDMYHFHQESVKSQARDDQRFIKLKQEFNSLLDVYFTSLKRREKLLIPDCTYFATGWLEHLNVIDARTNYLSDEDFEYAKSAETMSDVYRICDPEDVSAVGYRIFYTPNALKSKVIEEFSITDKPVR